MINEKNEIRKKCYNCYRPTSSCMCSYIKPIDTKTKFVILMHPKEFRKTKNGTGHFTNISLKNCELYVGIDFTNHHKINALLSDISNSCYILYPGDNSMSLNTTNIKQQNKTNVIFLIDSTWPCSKKILAVSKNLYNIPRLSFEHTKASQFKIKTQPNSYCLSTIESTLCVLELLNMHKIENIEENLIINFLKPFEKMVEYQVGCILKEHGSVRYKKPYKRK